MRPIFELDEILHQDAHEDGLNECFIDPSSTIKMERPRTYSDSSITSIDGDENTSKRHFAKTQLGINSISSSLTNNEPQPLFANELELYGTQLVHPLFTSSSCFSN